MNSFIDQLQIIIPLTSVIFIVILTSIHLLYRIRRLFPKFVNCWFCNYNTKVPYLNGNSWICPKCEQYNGFTEDGDYNQEIPAQRFNKLNLSKDLSFCEKTAASYESLNNGLCSHCNRNQELKIQQIASFVPKLEENYDAEIKEYKQQLEQSYQLCRRCQKTLKRTLVKVKSTILGSKLKQLGSKCLKQLNANIRKLPITPSKERQCLSTICFYTMLVFSVINLIEVAQSIDLSKTRLETLFSPDVTRGILMVVSYIGAFKQTTVNVVGYMLTEVNVGDFFDSSIEMVMGKFRALGGAKVEAISVENDVIMQTFGVVMSIGLFLAQTDKMLSKFVMLVLWNVGQYILLAKQNLKGLSDGLVCDLLTIAYVVVMTMKLYSVKRHVIEEVALKIKTKDNSFHRIYNEDSGSEISDSESENATSSSRFLTSSPRNRGGFGNKSVVSLNSTKSISPGMFQSGSVFESCRSPTSIFNGSMYRSNQDLRSVPLIPRKVVSENYLNKSFNAGYAPSNVNLNESFCSVSSSHQTPFNRMNNMTQVFNAPTISRLTNPNNISLESINLGMPLVNGGSGSFMNLAKGPFANELPRSPSAMSMRSSILTPSRLTHVATPVASQSWVAGGFWGQQTSPQKEHSHKLPPQLTVDFCPIFSRTSSQSSGFESHASSLHQGAGGATANGGRFSREGSFYNEELDRGSVFSEPLSANPRENLFLNQNYVSYGAVPRQPEHRSSAFSLKSMTHDLPQVPNGRVLKDWISGTNTLS